MPLQHTCHFYPIEGLYVGVLRMQQVSPGIRSVLDPQVTPSVCSVRLYVQLSSQAPDNDIEMNIMGRMIAVCAVTDHCACIAG